MLHRPLASCIFSAKKVIYHIFITKNPVAKKKKKNPLKKLVALCFLLKIITYSYINF
jgi:hypothetical protein